jgi:hypothetical protein
MVSMTDMRKVETLLTRGAALGLAALALGACSTMSESECRTVDWRTIGYEDGAAGYSGDRIGVHRRACAKYGVSTDLAAYQSGRDDGLREYCQPSNGFRIGSRGIDYGGNCPAPLEPAFLRAFESGHRLFALQQRASNASSQLAARRRELGRIQEDIEHAALTIISGHSSADDRAHALVETHELVERAGHAQSEIDRLEDESVRCQRDLEDYRATLAMNR